MWVLAKIDQTISDPWFSILCVILLYASLGTLVIFVITALMVTGTLKAIQATIETNPARSDQ